MLKIFTIQDKKLSIYSMIIRILDLKLFIRQNRMKQNRMKQYKMKQNRMKDEGLKNTNIKMDTIFMNSENRKTSEPHFLMLKLTDKLDLWRDEKSISLPNLSINYTWKNIKSSYYNDKLKISAPTCNDKFELPDGSYSVSDIQNDFEYSLKNHGEDSDNPSIRMYINKMEDTITL